MSKLKKLAKSNGVVNSGRRYNLSEMISESYRTLYDCPVDSVLYKMTAEHIENVKANPVSLDRLSENLNYLKGLVALGESVKLNEEEAQVTPDKTVKDESPKAEMSEEEERDLLNEDEELEVDDEEEDFEDIEDEELEEDDFEDIPPSEDDLEETEDVLEDEITPEELKELKKCLRELREGRKKKAAKPSKRVNENCSWASEKAKMTPALSKFRSMSKNKAFYKSFNKLRPILGASTPMTLEESLLLYKAANSAMTHLTVELEHNPEFIYTFRESTKLLSKDINDLLTCLKENKTPNKSLRESFYNFSTILLEAEEEEEETLVEEEEDELLPEPEDSVEECDNENSLKEEEEESLKKEEEEDVVKDEDESEPLEEEEEDVVKDEDESEPLEEEEEDGEITDEEEDLEEEEEDLEEEEDGEITDEEAEELKKRLIEIRKSKKARK